MTRTVDDATLDLITSLLFRKWTLPILQSLGTTTKRYSTLSRMLPKITQKVLTERLKQLERGGIVQRVLHSTNPPQVEYRLTEMGIKLLGVANDIECYFHDHSEAICRSQKMYDRRQKMLAY
ncbi:MAG: helix-turn-helix transcriptional regulator [Candidatus Nanosynbacter sp.]|jgi:putative transcriptional regulator superfamily|nr:helix-turn-helix transcriptional regulator [Candidatus Nanosynbacter sp.]